jgi:hypothetical protein
MVGRGAKRTFFSKRVFYCQRRNGVTSDLLVGVYPRA